MQARIGLPLLCARADAPPRTAMRSAPKPIPVDFGELEYDTLVTPSGPAWALRIAVDADLPDDAELWLWLREDGDFLEAASAHWADDQGLLRLKAKLDRDDDGQRAFVATLPFAALPSPCPRDLELYGELDDDAQSVEGSWDLQLPTRAARELGHPLGAFVAVVAEVVDPVTEAHLRRAEEVLQDSWQLDEAGQEMLRRALVRVRTGRADPELWDLELAALDDDDQAHLAEFLFEVLKAGGGPSADEEEAVAALFESFEIDLEIWRACRDAAPAEDVGPPASLMPAFEALGLEPDASWDEVRQAYEPLAAAYEQLKAYFRS